MVDVLFWSTNEDGIRVDEIKLLLSSKYQRRSCPELDAKAESIWLTEKSCNKFLYNASKFRLHSLEWSNDGKIELKIGLTSYQELVVTNLALMKKDMKYLTEYVFQYGKKHYGDRQACLADVLGVNTIVITQDRKIVLVHRSNNVQEFQDMIDFPGGHPEPEEVNGIEASWINQPSDDELELYSQPTLHEIFYAAIKEVRDEVNIPESKLSEPKLLGVLRCGVNANKPVATFMTRCTLTQEEILECYSKGCVEAFETTKLLFITIEDLKNLKDKIHEIIPGNLIPHTYTALLKFASLQMKASCSTLME